MKGICTDNPSVENLIVNNGVYVDKTDVLLGLVRDPLASQFFLSRPVWLVGCNYNPETRSLDKPAMERLG